MNRQQGSQRPTTRPRTQFSSREDPDSDFKGKGKGKEKTEGEGQEDVRGMASAAIGPGSRLPAVKGTMGAIESPRQRHRATASMSTVQDDYTYSRPTTPGMTDHHHSPRLNHGGDGANDDGDDGDRDGTAGRDVYPSLDGQGQGYGGGYGYGHGHGNGYNGYTPPPQIFRSDPTIRTTFDTMPLERKDEIKGLFV